MTEFAAAAGKPAIYVSRRGAFAPCADALFLSAPRDGYASSHNQRLEFLGDAVLRSFIPARFLLIAPDFRRRTRARFPRRALRLSAHRRSPSTPVRFMSARAFFSGNGEIVTGGADRDSILADAMEAIIGAVYLDGGEKAAKTLIAAAAFAGLRSRDPSGKEARRQNDASACLSGRGRRALCDRWAKAGPITPSISSRKRAFGRPRDRTGRGDKQKTRGAQRGARRAFQA